MKRFCKDQADLFAWADSQPASRPSAKIIDVMPALISKAAREIVYRIPNRKGDGKVIPLGRKAA